MNNDSVHMLSEGLFLRTINVPALNVFSDFWHLYKQQYCY